MLRFHARRAATFILGIALVSGSAGASTAPAGSLAHARTSIIGCRSNVTCSTRAVDGLGARLPASIRGGTGPSAWIRAAARLQGFDIQVLPVLGTSAAGSIATLYGEIGATVEGARISRALRNVNEAERRAIADLAGSLAAATHASKLATRGSGLDRIDPVRAMHLATFVADSPVPATAALRAEWNSVATSLARVNMPMIASAALTITEAIARTSGAHFDDDVDLPFISIGHDGNTTYKDPLLLQVDSSGDDTYLNNAGGGVVYAGGAIAIDQGSGSDTYSYGTGAQGWGLGAPGILYDEGGSDSYGLNSFGQGAGVGGLGLLYDAGNADDSYLSPGANPISTKAATLGGIGILVDEGGNDTLQQDGLDGFVYGAAGGLGLMANLGTGNDSYRSDEIPVEVLGVVQGTFAGPVQVSAEVGGAAILYEEGGDDSYVCGKHVRQGCQGAGGVGATGLLWDRAGNDTYWMGSSVSTDIDDTIGSGLVSIPVFPMGQGSGYGPSAPPGPGIGILRDEAGSDRYTAASYAQGFATLSGIGLLYDTGTNPDVYEMQTPLYGARVDGGQWVDGTGGFGSDS